MFDCLDGVPTGGRDPYRQCRLTRRTPEGVQVRVTWLPLKFSEPGMCVKLRDGGVWVDGWIVGAGPPGAVMDLQSIDRTRRTRLASMPPRRGARDGL